MNPCKNGRLKLVACLAASLAIFYQLPLVKYSTHIANPDVILIGSGVMSANLGALLKRLEPRLSIQVYEVTEELAQESSHGWNNAGTGHAGICELSYTPKREADGTVNVRKVIEIFE